MTTSDEPCECESEGFYCSGVPGILAHVEGGKVPSHEVSAVERCDQCERFASDADAIAELSRRGMFGPVRRDDWHVRYTSSPDCYDGFGTETLRVVGTAAHNGRPVREVQIDPSHLDWQESRYGSGSHSSYTDEQLAIAVRCGFVTEGEVAK